MFSLQAHSLQAQHDYLDRLDPQQRHAATTIDSDYLLILAGAGTGKTTVLVSRMLYLIFQKKINPTQLLAMTFTNQATQEMKSRFTLLGNIIPAIHTFHSFCTRVLRKHSLILDLSTDFIILDKKDSQSIIKKLIKEHNVDEKIYSASGTSDTIYRWQNHGLNPEDISSSSLTEDEEIPHMIYTHYTQYLHQQESCDFGGLILNAIKLLRDPHILKQYHKQFPYVMVDEYQDINIAQYLLLRLLCQKEDTEQRINLCCVGDEDQCIYEWRGSKVDHILNFQQDFKGSHIIKLEQNYRSTSHILNTANNLISKNHNRFPKTLFTKKPVLHNTPKVKIHVHQDSHSELSTIITEIQILNGAGISFQDIAILVRTAAQTDAFEEEFIKQGIPHTVIGGSFYDLQEIRDAIAYCRLVCQEKSNLAFERIINLPKRGIGKKTIEILQNHAKRHHISLFKATEEIIQTDELHPLKRKELHDFIHNIRRWNALINHMKSNHVAKIILEESGYIALWKNDKLSEKARERYENLKDLIGKTEQYQTLKEFIEHVSLREDQKSAINSPDRVKIMTLHAAKGLEFDSVFISGWEQGLFPHQRSLDEGDIEGERRLAYVGITRARNNCHLFYAIDRRNHHYHQQYQCAPSQFLLELYHPDHVEEIIHDDIEGNFSDHWNDSSEQDHSIEKMVARLKAGNRVKHTQFGEGTVLFVADNTIYVEFDDGESQYLLDSLIQKISD
ncbi:MAG: DNA helicase II [Candidatus Liberibacter ctenarytainae]|uniref:DNA 3'-5' helicase n=1 Tax=Candidatus Liberibacter ctenarytainae TaxID=2020335 RepID=A0A937DJ58_9HYPH|nr:DNA helicase II [Candidatus Liberibacter ctenarytainae]